ncbi:MAG: SRPBCC family protein [Candidatus Nanopelagicales bacterium]
MPSTVTESIQIQAPPQTVYELIADRSGVARISPEASGTLRSTGALGVGDTFWGTNRRGPWRWATRCRITAAEPGRAFGFDVDVGPFPISTWTYGIEPTESGCVVTETWLDRRDGVRGRLITAGGSLFIPGPREEHNRANIRSSLAALKAAAE